MVVSDLDPHLPGIVAGDPAAFSRWVAGAEPVLRRSLRSFAAHVDTEAVVQEALLTAWQVAPRIRPDGRPDCLLRFSLRVARNRAISELRRARVDPVEVARLEQLAATHAEKPPMPDPLLRRVIQQCRDKLPRRPARALGERIASRGNTPDAVLAERAGMTLNTFLQNVRRARLAMARCLRSQGVSLKGVAP
ncbi:MAG: hypothetical protein D6798_13750 [Deltaproteobacteria bacterium]|nr:MAG: hypothetical protein D6798_13750 [Deltaproteobacteria bacterium]